MPFSSGRSGMVFKLSTDEKTITIVDVLANIPCFTKSAAGFTATAGRAGDTSIPSATPRISPLLAFMPTKAANAMTKMGMMILNICCLHSEMPKRIMPLRRQANRLFPNAAEGPAGGYCHSRPKSVRGRRCGTHGSKPLRRSERLFPLLPYHFTPGSSWNAARWRAAKSS